MRPTPAAGCSHPKYVAAVAQHIGGDEHALTEIASLELGDQILPGNQAGDRNAVSEKVVSDFHHFSIQIIAFYSGFVKQKRHGRRSSRAGRDRERTRAPAFVAGQRKAELLHKQRQHADTVFELGEVLVIRRVRQRAAGFEVQLVPAPDQAGAQFLQAFLRKRLDDIEDGRGRRFVGRLERIQALAVVCHPERHDRNRVHRRIQLFQVVQRAA